MGMTAMDLGVGMARYEVCPNPPQRQAYMTAPYIHIWNLALALYK